MLRQLLSSHDNVQSIIIYPLGMNHASLVVIMVIYSFGISHAPSVVNIS